MFDFLNLPQFNIWDIAIMLTIIVQTGVIVMLAECLHKADKENREK